MGNRHPSIAPYETLRCADGMLAVACGNDGQFARICAVLGRADLAEDPRFATNPARVRHRPDLVEALEKELARQDVVVWAERLTAVGIAAGAVNDLGGALELADRLGLSPTTSVGDGHPDQVRHPITWSRSPVRTPPPPPALGEHSTAAPHPTGGHLMSTNATLPAFDPHDPAGIDDLLTDDERAVRSSVRRLCAGVEPARRGLVRGGPDR